MANYDSLKGGCRVLVFIQMVAQSSPMNWCKHMIGIYKISLKNELPTKYQQQIKTVLRQ
jgi:hypothetical protein